MKEIWTTEAKNTFKDNISYLKNRWSINEINTFVEKTFKVIDMVLENPDIGKYDESWKANKFLIVPQIYLFYEVDVNKNCVVLLSFWNNYQEPI